MDSLTAKAESKPKAKAKVKPMPSSKLHSTQPALVLPAPVRTVHMSVGSGIVLESQAQDEWLELETKRRFVAQAFTTPLGLIETMRLVWSAQHQAWHIPLLPAHLERLSLSAIQLGLAQDRAAVQRQVSAFIQAQLAALAAPSAAAHTEAQRARLVWQDYAPTNSSQSNSAQAALQWQVEALQRPQTPVSLCWAHDLGASAIDPDLALLAHKTTWRQGYTALLAAAQARGCWDAIAINRRGEVCEGARSNILLDLGEVDATGAPLWLTPARTAGLLPGVMRAQLLAGHKVNMPVREAVLTPNDARAARALAVCNALHGVLPAVWVQGQDWASL